MQLVIQIGCEYKQRVYARYLWRDGILRHASSGYSSYDAFTSHDLIPSLVHMVDKTSESNRPEAVKKWVMEHGLLTASAGSRYELPDQQEALTMFWKEAEAFTVLWRMYRHIANRELPELKKLLTFKPVEDALDCAPPDCLSMTLFQYERGDDGVISHSFGPYYFKKTVQEIEKAPLRPYQWAALLHLKDSVEAKLSGLTIASNKTTRASGENEDTFNVISHLLPQTLLEAMYLRLYIMLNDNKSKICPVCDRQFLPYRRDQKYCETQGPCKKTQKSRRYRARQTKKKEAQS